MGLEDRDWYWRRRARRDSPDDDYLFPGQHRPDRKSALFPIALVILAALAVLTLGLHQGWFDRDWRSRTARAQAEIAALRPWEQQRSLDVRPPAAVPEAAGAPRVETFHDKHRLSIEFTLFGLMMLSPLVLLGLLVGLFVRPARGPALFGLLLGTAGAVVGGNLRYGGLLFRLGLLQPADSMGSAFQFLEVIAASFTITATAGVVAVLVFGKPASPSDAAPMPPREIDEPPKGAPGANAAPVAGSAGVMGVAASHIGTTPGEPERHDEATV